METTNCNNYTKDCPRCQLDPDDHWDMRKRLPDLHEALKQWSPHNNKDERVTVRRMPEWLHVAAQSIAEKCHRTGTQVLACELHLGLLELEGAVGVKTRRRIWRRLREEGSIIELASHEEAPFYSWTCAESAIRRERQAKIPVPEWSLGVLSDFQNFLHCSQDMLAQVSMILGLARADDDLLRFDFLDMAVAEAKAFFHWLITI